MQTLIVVGDCQALVLKQALASDAFVCQQYEIHMVSVEHLGAHTELPDDVWQRCSVVWLQVGSEFLSTKEDEPDAVSPKLNPAARVIRFPAIWLRAIWPNHLWDPLYNDPVAMAEFPYSDSILIELSKGDLQSGALVDVYEEKTSRVVPRLAKQLERETQLIVARDLRVDVPMGGYILSNFKRHRLFFSYNHPTRMVMRELLQRLITATWPQESKEGSELAGAAARNEHLKRTDTLHMYDYPVASSIASSLGLQWWSEDDEYLSDVYNGTRTARRFGEYVEAFIENRRRRLRDA